jgi:glycolate oxidase FAD binding subunit
MAISLPPVLLDILGRPSCLVSSELAAEYAVDGLVPTAVVQPENMEAVAAVLKWANENGLAVIPRGGGTQAQLGNAASGLDITLDLSRFNRLLDYQPADLTATVEAGMTLAEFQRQLAQRGKMAALEAPLSSRATIGGILSVNASGPLRRSYGLPRDSLIGISVVGPDGVETKAGGRVVKNVTGYDLNKLYAGSLGTLGVIVEATFKLATIPAASGAVVAGFDTLEAATAAADELLQATFAPQGVHVVNALSARRLDSPHIADTVARIAADGAVVIGYAAGRQRAVQRILEQSGRLLQERVAVCLERLEPAGGADLLRQHTDFGWTEDSRPWLGVKLDLPPSKTTSALARLTEIGLTAPPGVVADPGFGTARLLWWDDNIVDDPAAVRTIQQLRAMARSLGGSAVAEHCPLAVKRQIDVWGDSPNEVEIMRRIKQNFDPLGTLNPGRAMGKI